MEGQDEGIGSGVLFFDSLTPALSRRERGRSSVGWSIDPVLARFPGLWYGPGKEGPLLPPGEGQDEGIGSGALLFDSLTPSPLPEGEGTITGRMVNRSGFGTGPRSLVRTWERGSPTPSGRRTG